MAKTLNKCCKQHWKSRKGRKASSEKRGVRSEVSPKSNNLFGVRAFGFLTNTISARANPFKANRQTRISDFYLRGDEMSDVGGRSVARIIIPC